MILFKFLVIVFLIFLSYQIDAKVPSDAEIKGTILFVAIILLADYVIEEAFSYEKVLERKIEEIHDRLSRIEKLLRGGEKR